MRARFAESASGVWSELMGTLSLSKHDDWEALFFVYFLALLLEALIERELRRAMARENVKTLPI